MGCGSPVLVSSVDTIVKLTDNLPYQALLLPRIKEKYPPGLSSTTGPLK